MRFRACNLFFLSEELVMGDDIKNSLRFHLTQRYDFAKSVPPCVLRARVLELRETISPTVGVFSSLFS